MCVCHIQFAGYTGVYVVPVCSSYVESNSVPDADDDTTSAVSPTRRGAHEKTYNHGTRNRRRKVYTSYEVWMLWLPEHNNRPRCLRQSTVPSYSQLGDTRATSLGLRGVIIKPLKQPTLHKFEHLKHLEPCLQRSLSSLE